jgi:hypothetical protein
LQLRFHSVYDSSSHMSYTDLPSREMEQLKQEIAKLERKVCLCLSDCSWVHNAPEWMAIYILRNCSD